MYKKKTPEQWVKDLITDKFATVGNARKSLAKTGWSDRMKARARQCIDQQFTHPGSVKVRDMTGGEPTEEPVVSKKKKNGKQTTESFTPQVPVVGAVLQPGVPILYKCRELLDTLKVAHELYPEADISDGRVVVDRLLAHAIEEMGMPLGGASSVDIDPALLVPKAPPIVPHFTPEQKELFDKTKPKNPIPSVS